MPSEADARDRPRQLQTQVCFRDLVHVYARYRHAPPCQPCDYCHELPGPAKPRGLSNSTRSQMREHVEPRERLLVGRGRL